MAFVPATPPDSTKRSLRSRLITRTRERWPDLADLTTRHRGQFVYVDGELRVEPRSHTSGCATADRRTAGVSRSTSPAATATRTPPCPAATPSVPPKKHSTAPAASTSTTHRLDQTPDELTGETTSEFEEVDVFYEHYG
jgi:hypothetical protein